MSGKYIENLPCPKCSNTSEPLGVYMQEDGSYDAYCHKCGHYDPDPYSNQPADYVKPTVRRGNQKTVQWVLDNSSVAPGLPERNISAETCEKYGYRVGYNSATREVDFHYAPFYRGGKLVGFQRREVATKDFDFIGDGKNITMFGQDICGKEGKLLIITEGMIDCMAVVEMLKTRGKNYRVCSLPNGANARAIKNNYEWLIGFDSIFLSYDQDTPGETCVTETCEILPIGKASVLHFSENDPGQMWLEGKEAEYWQAFYSATKYQPDGIVSIDDIFEEAIRPVKHGLSWPWKTLTEATYGVRRGEVYGFGAGSGCGKCLTKGTEVRLSDGTLKRVEDISLGDELLTPTVPSHVVALGSGTDDMFKVSQSDGTSYTVNSDHILSVIMKGKKRDINVVDAAKLATPVYGYNAEVDYPERNVLIPPYILGIWLGDGHNGSASLTCGDEAILDEWSTYGESIGLTPTEYTGEVNCRRVNLTGHPNYNPLYKVIRGYGLHHNKHIPDDYLINDKSSRRELLAGLLDTDGYQRGSGSYEFTSKYEVLGKHVELLSRSLGLRVRRTDKVVNDTVYQRLSIHGDLSEVPFRVTRKVQTSPGSNKSRLTITKDGPGEYYGFTLAGDKHFCLGNYTVTHNTEGFKEIINHIIYEHKLPAGVIFLEEPAAKTAKVLAGKRCNKRFHIPDGDYTIQELTDGINDLKGRVYLYNHFGSKDWGSIQAKIRYMVSALGIKDIFLDHLTALVAQEDNEYTALNKIMEEMASLVEELDCTIFYISHLRKAQGTPHEEGGRVHADQFKGSGAIVYWSHFLFGYERDQQSDDMDVRNTTTFRCLKDRNTGLATGTTFQLFYDHSTGRWDEKTDDDGLIDL